MKLGETGGRFVRFEHVNWYSWLCQISQLFRRKDSTERGVEIVANSIRVKKERQKTS